MSVTLNGWVVAALAVTGAVGAWAFIFFYVPRSVRSLARHSLWAQRDELFLEVVDKRLPPTPGVRSLMCSIEHAIEYVGEITVFGAVSAALIGHDLPDSPLPSVKDAKVLSPQQLENVQRRERRFVKTLMFAALLGSPSGWLVLVFSPAIALILFAFALGVRSGRRRVQPKELPTTLSARVSSRIGFGDAAEKVWLGPTHEHSPTSMARLAC